MKDTELTKGPIFKELIRFSLPMIAGNMLQQVYNFADALIVGRCISADALAAVGSAYTLMVFISSVIIGLCMGSGAFFSADYGAENGAQLKEDIRLSFRFILAVSVALELMVYPSAGVILRVLQTPQELMEFTREYVLIVFSGIIFVFLYNFFAYLLRAVGKQVIPLIMLMISSVLNVLLDLLFVPVLKMGVGGAALATVISQAVAGVGLLLYARLKLPILKSKEAAAGSPHRLRQIIINDASTCVQQSVMNFGILMIQGLVNSFDTVIMAAFAAAVKIDTLAYMPAQEFGNAYSLFVSQNYGAGERERIRKGTKTAFAASAVFCLAVSVVIFMNAENLMRIFIDSAELTMIAEGAKYLRIEGAMYVGIGVLFLWYGYFRGVGRPHISLILTVISLGTRVVLSYALAPNTPLGVTAIWLSIPIGWLLADIAGIVFYHGKKRT